MYTSLNFPTGGAGQHQSRGKTRGEGRGGGGFTAGLIYDRAVATCTVAGGKGGKSSTASATFIDTPNPRGNGIAGKAASSLAAPRHAPPGGGDTLPRIINIG